MDIKILSAFLPLKPAVSEPGDLLAQLKAAGTIEVEVIKVLQGKLLLGSRLGEILAANTLNYKPGDQFNLRLSGDTKNPVLKASPRIPGPQILDSTRNPHLRQLLPPGQSVLAMVSGMTARHIEIRLAGQILSLPPQSGVTRNQLIGLLRNDASRSIEITPLDRKLIYKALLKQLLPDQLKSNSTSLIKLLNLLKKTLKAIPPEAAPTTASSRQLPQMPIANKRQSRASQPPGIPVKTPAAPPADKPPVSSKSDTRTPVVPGRTGALLSRETTPRDGVAPTTSNRLPVKLLPQVFKTDTRPNAPSKPQHPAATRSAPATQAVTSNTSSSVPKPSFPDRESIGSGSARSNPTAVAGIKAATPGPSQWSQLTLPGHEIFPTRANVPRKSSPDLAKDNAPRKPAPDLAKGNAPRKSAPDLAQVNVPGELIPSLTRPRTNAPPTLLQILLQMIPRVPDIDGTRIKQWLEFSSLIRSPDTKSGNATPGNALKTLQQLLAKGAFSRELDLAPQPMTKTPDDANAKPAPREVLLAQVRDGMKLLEQAVSQNLFQRASLAMQQETQQLPSLNFALPFLDQQEVKPLQIALNQRGQAKEEEEQSWDIQLSFELADLGPVACHVFLQGVTVAASFYCEEPGTRNRVEQALPELKQQLSTVGFSANELHSFPGKPDQSRPSARASYTEQLIDIEV